MRILRCDINGFGALCDYHIDFSSDVTSIVEENGFGKTTLAAFIKAMFFGMPTARKNSSTESSDRARYNPWSAPYFGGQLVFSLTGKEYRIIRKFDAKSPTRDEFRLIDEKTGLDCTDFSENIGEELFKINEESFSKSTFSNGSVNLDGLPAGIRAKISSSVNVADDLDSYDLANKRLKDAYKSKKKLIDSCLDSIQTSKNAIETLKRDKEEYIRISEQIAILSGETKALEEREKELIIKGQAQAKLEADVLKKKNYDEAKEKCIAMEKELSNILESYKNTVPDKELCEEFSRAVSDNDEIKIMLNAQEQNLQRFNENGVFEKIESDYPSKQKIDEMLKLENELSQNAVQGTKKALPKFLLPLLSAFVCLGVALTFVNLIAAIIIIALGSVSLAAVIAITLSAHSSAKLSDKYNSAKKEYDAFIEKYYDSDANINRLTADLQLYENHFKPVKNKTCELKNALEDNLKNISELIDKIGYKGENTSNFTAIDSQIKRDSERYIQLKSAFLEYKNRMQENYDEAAFERISTGVTDDKNLENELYGIREKAKEISERVLAYRRNLYVVSSAQENLNEHEQNLENESENLEKYRKQSEIIVKTLKLLEDAKNELFKKYAGKVMLSFEKYTDIFFGENNKDFAIGNEFDVTVKRENIARAASLFSEGQQSIIDVCLRLSLVDAMFENERPFLILDDPFYALDDDNFKKASELIREISKDTQVIYLTCHTSRKI